MKKLQKYTFEELVSHNEFCAWVLSGQKEHNAFWQAWMLQYPAETSLVEEATHFVEQVQFESIPVNEAQLQDAWLDITAQIDALEGEAETAKLKLSVAHRKAEIQNTRIHHKKLNLWKYAAAAMVVGALFIANWVFWFNTPSYEVHATNFGEKRTITLSDASVVTLNANSSLKLAENWQKNDMREVWLEGEAFFEVSHQPIAGQQQFVVHTDQYDVRVLGTAFNVINRTDLDRVVLSSGQVELALANAQEVVVEEEGISEAQSIQTETITMQPGDLVEMQNDGTQSANKVLQHKKGLVNTAAHISWRSDELIFDETPLSELVRILENSYGLTVKVDDAELLQETLGGTLPNNDLNTLLRAVSATFDLRVKKTGDKSIELKLKK